MRKYISLTILGGVLMLALVTVIAITYPQIAASSPITIASTPRGLADILPPGPPGTSAEQAPQITGTYLWSYSAKFVCGYQAPLLPTDPGEPVVKPGNYATEINIHNENISTPSLVVKKMVIILVDPTNGPVGLEPNAQTPRSNVNVSMGSNTAMMDDCNAIWTMIHQAGGPPPPNPMPLMIGYLVILDPLDLNVDVVYTAEVPGTGAGNPTGISINVTRVGGKRIFAPTGTYP
jgi:hypothetical protein